MERPAGIERRIDIGAAFSDVSEGEGELTVAVEIFLPERLRMPAVALFCQPGGGIHRGYYNLVTAAGDTAFSFAAQMTEAGFIVVAIDHLGIGASSRPAAAYRLTPAVLTAANARVVDRISAELRAGELHAGLPALPQLRTIGVGHSMGAMLTAMQQAQYRQHTALALLGFSTGGLSWALSEREAAFAGDPQGARANIVALAQRRATEPYPELPAEARASDIFAGANSDPEAVAASKRCNDRLLVAAGLFSMIPGACAPDCAEIDTPLFLCVGTRDIAGVPHTIPAAFPRSADIELLVLPDTAHCHFLFPTTAQLFERLARWIGGLVPAQVAAA